MAKFVCDSGTLTFESTDIGSMCVNSISLDVSAETVEFLCMGNDGWSSKAPSTKSWEVSFETALDGSLGVDLDATIGQEGTLLFDTVSGGVSKPSYGGEVIITGISISTPVNEYATVSWTAVGTGALTETLA